jgi:hypothetical protein
VLKEEIHWQHLDHCLVREQEAIRAPWLNSNKVLILHHQQAVEALRRKD